MLAGTEDLGESRMGNLAVRNGKRGWGKRGQDLMAICHNARKGRHIRSHWSKPVAPPLHSSIRPVILPLLAVAVLCSMFAAVNSATAQGLTFTTNAYSVGSGPGVNVADVNGDGKLDLITANYNTNTSTVLTNNGSGGFGFYATLKVGNCPQVVIAADVNGDGKLALISANQNDNTLTVLTNNGSGVFGSNATLNIGTKPQYVVAADINGDGKLDLISPNWTSPGTLTVLTNNGSGIFGFNATLTVGKYPVCVVAADVNGDGYVDLITANYGANTLTVLTNNGSGVFGLNATLTVGDIPECVIAADVNGDGKLDLISANVGTNTLTVLTNNGNGVFGFSATLTNGENQPFSVAAVDLNGDGKLDLISANGGIYPTGIGNTLTVFTNDGRGVFGSNATITVGKSAYSVVAADLNADGKPDLIVGNFKDNTVTVLMNTSIFPPATNFPKLTIKQQGRNMRVAWPSVSPGWSLQEKPDLTKPNWLPSGYDGYPIAEDGVTLIADDRTNKSLTFPLTRGNLFFRLLHP